MNGEGGPSSDSLQVKKKGFQWVVKKEVFTEQDKIYLHSRSFNFGFEECTKWYLRLRPRLPSSDGVIYVGLFLMPVGYAAAVRQIRTKFKMGLLTKVDKEINVKSLHHVFTNTKDGWGWGEFIKLDSLLAEENNFFKNGELTIFCDLEMYRRAEVPESPLVLEQSERLESGEFSDFTLVVGGEELKVHRCMLATKSPVFRAMFQHEMKEKQSGRVEIEELDVVGVKGMLEFIYTGRVQELEKIAKKILPAADRYGVEKLKILCEQELCCKLGPTNAAELLQFAELHMAARLKEHALTFICENLSEVVKERSFRRLNGSDIFMEVLDALADKAQSGKPLAKRIKLSH